MTSPRPSEAPCTCPEWNHRTDRAVGPHRHIVVAVEDLRVGDRTSISEVTSAPALAEVDGRTWVHVEFTYDGGLVATNEWQHHKQLAVTRPVGAASR